MVKIQSSLLNVALSAFRKGVAQGMGDPSNALHLNIEHNKCKLFYVSDDNIIEYYLSCESNEIVEFIISFDAFERIIKTIDNEAIITIKDDKSKIIISNDKSKAKHKLIKIVKNEVKENRELPSSSMCNFTIDPLTFIEAVDIAKIAIDKDTHRFPLGDVCLHTHGKHITLVGTDAKRLATRTIGIGEDLEDAFFIITSKPLDVLYSFCKTTDNVIEITLFENQIKFELKDKFLYIGNRGAGQYPNYRKVIPEEFDKEIKINTNEFLRSVREVVSLSNGKRCGLNIKFQDDNIIKMDISNIVGDSNTTIPYKPIRGDFNNFKIRIDFKFIIDFISKIKDEETTIQFGEGIHPVNMTCDDFKDNTFLISMPMRFEDELEDVEVVETNN